MLEVEDEKIEEKYEYENEMLTKLAFKIGVAFIKANSKKGLRYKDLQDKKKVTGKAMTVEEHEKLKDELDKKFKAAKK